MKQLHVTFLLTVLMSMMGIEATAHNISVANSDGVTIYYNWINNSSELSVTYRGSSYSNYSNEYTGNVVIPESVTYNGNSYPVTSIGDCAFYDCSGLTSITIPYSVTSIGSNAFHGTALHNNAANGVFYVDRWICGYKGNKPTGNLVLAEDSRGIAGSAFSNCTGLTSVTIPNSVTNIGSQAFYNCSSLTSVTIPNSVTNIGSQAFYNCSGLTSLTIPNSVTSIGSSAFYGCSGLTSVTIPNSVTSICDNAFGSCNKLESVTIGSGVLSIGSNVFKNHTPTKVIWLTNTPPSGYANAAGTINYVANNLYTSLSNKTEYKFLSSMFEVDGVKYVPVSPSERTCDAIDCLYDNNAENIHIGKTVTNKGITLTVKQVHPYAFYRNPYIKNIELTFDGNIGDYAFYGLTGSFTANINNAGTIGVSAFYGSTGLTTLQIGSRVTNVGNYAFYGCTGLTTATINNKGSLGSHVFQGCTGMTTTTLGEEISSLGSYAFYGCSSLQGIVIPNAVKTIGQYGFQSCSAMTSVKIGTGVKSIETYTFAGCSSLTDMQIGSNVTTINTYAFSNCTSLQEISIPRTVTDIKNYVFKDCSGLKTVSIEDRETVLNLGYGSNSSNKTLFSDCPLEAVYIGGNISYDTSKSCGYSPFYRNTTLQTVTITDKETEISENEFYGCTSLKNVSIGDGVESIGNWAFSGCSSLEYFAFGTALKTIGKEAFSDCTGVTQIISRAATPPTCGSMALDDIDKWTCTLVVPPGDAAPYQSADQWKEFFFIQEEKADNLWFKLTYMVDGEEYKVYNKLYGTTVEPEAAPEKEGYTFSGWSLIPETMPARDVIIVGTFTKSPEEQPYEPDLSQTDNVIYVNSAEVHVGNELTLPIKMKNNVAIRGFQFDLYLPDGVTPAKNTNGRIKASLTTNRLPEDDEHTLTVSEQQDGAIRFLCGSQYNETFTGSDGEIATIKLNIAEDMEAGTYPMVLRNIKLTESNINKYYVADGISAMLTVLNHVTGDINADLIVDVSDYIGIANHIMGDTPEGFNEKAADVNTDNAIDVSDYIGVANIIMFGSVYGEDNNASRSLVRKVKANASADDNVIYVKPLAATSNSQVQLSLKMKNTAEIRGFQLDLYLPEGVTAIKGGNGKIRANLAANRLPEDDRHTLTVSEQKDGAIRFLCASQYNETFTGNDGEIATLLVDVAANVEAEDHPVYLRNMKLSESDIRKFYQTEELGTTLAVAPEGSARGDANGDKSVSVTDIAVVVNEILQIANTGGFLMYGADANGDGDITVTDIGVIVDKILGTKTSANSRKMEQEVEPQ